MISNLLSNHTSSIKNHINKKLIGDSVDNNIFMAFKAVKDGLLNQMSKDNETL